MSKLHTVLLTLILAITSLNLVLTLNLYGVKADKASVTAESSPISSQLAKKLAGEVVDLYNKRDFENLYNKFDKQAQIKLDKKQFKAQLLALHALFGEVLEYDYTNSMKIGEKQHEQYYQLFYATKVSSDKVSKANLTLSVIVEGDNLTLYGVKLNASQLPEH